MDAPSPNRRFYSDGRAIWYIDRLWPLVQNAPEFDFAVDQCREMDEVCWFSEAWGKRPTCRAVLDHCRRIMEADLSYPIIIGPRGMVLDGVHRICRAMLEGRATVRAVRLDPLPPPDETLSPDDPRYQAPVPDGEA